MADNRKFIIPEWSTLGMLRNTKLMNNELNHPKTRSIGVSTDLGICMDIPEVDCEGVVKNGMDHIYSVPPDAYYREDDIAITYAEDGDGHIVHYSCYRKSDDSSSWDASTSYVNMDQGNATVQHVGTQTIKGEFKTKSKGIVIIRTLILFLALVNIGLLILSISINQSIKIPDSTLADLELHGAIRVSGYSKKFGGEINLILISMSEYEKIRNISTSVMEAYLTCDKQLNQEKHSNIRYLEVINELRATCFKDCLISKPTKSSIDYGRDFSRRTKIRETTHSQPRSPLPPNHPCSDENKAPWFCKEGGLPVVHYPLEQDSRDG